MAEETEMIGIGDFDNDTTCLVCYAEFLDPEDLKVHISQVHAASTYKSCQFCLTPYSDMDEYAWHIIETHIVAIKCCKYCSRAFINYDERRRHETKHRMPSGDSVFSCSNCKSVFDDRNDLEHHEITSHSDSIEGVSLHYCYKFLSSYLNLKAETFLQSLHKKKVNFSCTKCKHNTVHVIAYIKHVIANKCRSLVCDACSEVFPDKAKLEKHFAMKMNCGNLSKQKVKKVICQECNQYIDISIMKKHRKTCKQIKCNSCNVIFKTMDKLTEHQSKEHPLAISLVYCKYCHKEFVGKVALERHTERTHKDELHLYKYYCVYCDNIFKHPKLLFAHFFSKHKELQPYTCKICDIQFKLRKKFTLHIKIDHKSVGFVEFDENFHVFFTDKRSQNPFVPCAEGEHDIDHNYTKINLKQVSKDDNKNEHNKSEKEECTDINMEFMNMTETEANQTEIEQEPKKIIKRKRKFKYTLGNITKKRKKKSINEDIIDKLSDFNSDDDDQPLLVLRKRGKKRTIATKHDYLMQNTKPDNMKKGKKNKFICEHCKRNCYTFQNYHNHMSLHYKKESKKCIKCSRLFKTKAGLKEHMATIHSTSKLTETLKNLLERRKRGEPLQETHISTRDKFLKTIVKVPVTKNDAVVKVTPLEKELSVQKFIENFTPEDSTKKNIKVEAMVSMTICPEPMGENIKIKMKRFTSEDYSKQPIGLSLPKKIKVTNTEVTKVSVKVVQKPKENNKPKLNFGTTDTAIDHNQITDHTNEELLEPDQYEEATIDYDYYNQDNNIGDEKHESSIPEVAQEVMLESNLDTEEVKMPTSQIQSTLVIPKLPQAYGSIRIAHLLPEAPYFKIVKVDDYLKEQEANKGMLKDEDQDEDIKLPGTKLVNVNPLAHLLGDKPVESLMLNTNKHYQPKTKNFEKAIAKALLELENPGLKMKKKKKLIEIEQ